MDYGDVCGCCSHSLTNEKNIDSDKCNLPNFIFLALS